MCRLNGMALLRTICHYMVCDKVSGLSASHSAPYSDRIQVYALIVHQLTLERSRPILTTWECNDGLTSLRK